MAFNKDYDGTRIRIAGIPHLIEMKTGTGRVLDQDDIVKLETIRQQGKGKDG